MIYRIIGELLGFLCVMFLVSYLRREDFSIVDITQIIGVCLLHRVALMLEVRYFLSPKVKKMEDEKSG